MTRGRITLFCGLALLVLGVGMLIYGITADEAFGIARGISSLVIGSIFIPWGKRLIVNEHEKKADVPDFPSHQSTESVFHDGYVLKEGNVLFYDGTFPERTPENDYMVDEEKVGYHESMCYSYRQNFMEVGWLRLHMPFRFNEEYLGTYFLFVPENHRARIAAIIGDYSICTMDDFKKFFLAETGYQFTLEDLTKGQELVDITSMGQANRENLLTGLISQDEYEHQVKKIQQIQQENFHGFSVFPEGMFAAKP